MGEILGPVQVAAILQVSRSTVQRIPRETLDYAVTPGGWRRYDRDAVDRYARQLHVTPSRAAR